MCAYDNCNAKPQPTSSICERCLNEMRASFRNFSPPRWTGPDARANRPEARADRVEPVYPLMKQPSSYSQDDPGE